MPIKKWVVPVLLLLGAGILGAYFGGFLTLLPPSDYDENTVIMKYWQTLVGGSIVFVAGYWNDPSSSSHPQLLDSPLYATSWKQTGNSEAIIPTASIALSLGVLKNAEWRYYTSAGGSWDLVKSTPAYPPISIQTAATIPPPNPLYYLTGEFNGWLRVMFWAEFWAPGVNVFDGDIINDRQTEQSAWIRDDARLISGRGTIVTPRELQVFEVGQTIDITVDLGSACTRKTGSGDDNATQGYTLELYSQAQGQTIKTWDLPCGPGTFSVDSGGQRLSYLVSANDFRIGTTCQNRLELRLLNDLFLKDRTDVKTIDLQLTEKPEPPTIDVSAEDGIWEEGKEVTITVHTDRTDAFINLVVKNENGAQILRVDASSQFNHTFLPTVAGLYKVVVSIEVACGASDPVEYVITIKEGTPPDSDRVGGDLLWLILIAISIILFLVAWKAPMPLFYGWLVRGLIVLAAAGLLVWGFILLLG